MVRIRDFKYINNYIMDKINISEEKKSLCRRVKSFIKENKINELKEIITANDNSLFAVYKIHYDSTMLYDAAFAGNIDICRLLMEFQADVNEDANSETALVAAAVEGHLEICKWLVEKGAFIDGNVSSVITPLSSSIIFGHEEIAKYLIEKGANINAVHLTQHQTPLDYARIWGCKEIEKILQERNAISLTKPIEWEKEFGGTVLKYVNDNAGSVLPIHLVQMVSNSQKISLRMAQVNKKQHKYLFTIGLFAIHQPMIELFIVLPATWNLNDNSPENMFPCMLLMTLSEMITNGKTISEGDFISCDMPELSKLKWYAEIDGFWVCDYPWNRNKPKSTKPDDSNTVTLLTLIPEKKTKAKKELMYDAEKHRNATWNRICLGM